MTKSVVAMAVVLFLSAHVYSQSCPQNFLGSKTLYAARQQKLTPPPAGYVPVFINHVGRHGARHLTSDVNTSYLYKLLQKADSLKALTAKGLLLKEKLLMLEKIEKNNFKSISSAGKEEQKGLALRMVQNYGAVFSEAKPVIQIAYTKEVRTLQSSDAFLTAMQTVINTAAVSKKINDTTLRFYDLSPAYTKFKNSGNWILGVDKLKASVLYGRLAEEICNPLFTPAFLKTLDEKEEDKITSDLYGFLTISYSLQKEAEEMSLSTKDISLHDFFTCSQLAVLAGIDNAEDFLVKGPGTDSSGIQVRIAAPLLADFIKTTDTFIQSNTVNAQLRFSHAETVAPFAALMEIAGASEPEPADKLHAAWKAENVVPLSANIQWVLYKNAKRNGWLIKFLLNEKEERINGLKPVHFPYYEWATVRNFFVARLARLNASLQTNYTLYLKNLAE